MLQKEGNKTGGKETEEGEIHKANIALYIGDKSQKELVV